MRINLNNFLAIGCWTYRNFPPGPRVYLATFVLATHSLTIPNTTLTPYISLALCVFVPTFIVTQGSNLKLMYNSAPSGTNHCIMVDLTALDVLKYLKRSFISTIVYSSYLFYFSLYYSSNHTLVYHDFSLHCIFHSHCLQWFPKQCIEQLCLHGAIFWTTISSSLWATSL